MHDIPTNLLNMFTRRLSSRSFNSYFSVLSKATKHCVMCTIPQCLTCADGPTCTLCSRNYIPDVNNASKSCVSCLSNEYSLNSQCLKCFLADNKCLSCYFMTSSINCTFCQPQWIPNPSIWTCVKCESIIPNCKECKDIQNCTLCHYPYKLGANSKCDEC